MKSLDEILGTEQTLLRLVRLAGGRAYQIVEPFVVGGKHRRVRDAKLEIVSRLFSACPVRFICIDAERADNLSPQDSVFGRGDLIDNWAWYRLDLAGAKLRIQDAAGGWLLAFFYDEPGPLPTHPSLLLPADEYPQLADKLGASALLASELDDEYWTLAAGANRS